MKKIRSKLFHHLISDVDYNDNNNCCVNSLTIAFNSPYKKIHSIIKMKGNRKHGEGMFFESFVKNYRSWLERKFKVKIRKSNKYKTYNQIKKSYKGMCLVATSGHLNVFKDGKFYDFRTRLPNRRVEYVLEVIKNDQLN